ncbi:hypothetical protein Afil01_61810 [Actinorhabdospora filicis]|uniref:Aerobactin siderophore biosynthesis IucA/IucC-like C-terminal domain-containing protein n=1 Tax=Actinorhabdospora filicis TaxID=1785913 RepID=A0A9W6SR27_9ACTN|nr:IucA/IucC family C-terminal-domain containing protein [Actinorhabdospora filicis]GLZ81374.1 hypothetical protein Afil01_61810 [Actinorhabdospora filicis]
MTTILPPAYVAPAPLAPITRAMDAIRRSRGDERVAGVAEGLVLESLDGYIPASCLTDGSAIGRLLDAPRERWGAAPHAAAALAWKGYAFWLALPAVVGWTTCRRVPLLHASNVHVRIDDERPYYHFGMRRAMVAVLRNDPAAGMPGVRVVDDEAALLDVLRATLVDQHLTPLLTQIRGQVRVGRRILWGSLASGVAHAVEYAADIAPLSIVESVQTLVDALRVPGLVEVSCDAEGAMDLRRRTCCLAFTVDGLSTCRSCCVSGLTLW